MGPNVREIGAAKEPADQPDEIVTALSKFMEDAQALHKWAEDRERPEGDLKRTSDEWHGRVQGYLETHLGPDYKVRFHSHYGLQRLGGSYPLSFSQERIELCEDLDFDIRRLTEFIVEVRRRLAWPADSTPRSHGQAGPRGDLSVRKIEKAPYAEKEKPLAERRKYWASHHAGKPHQIHAADSDCEPTNDDNHGFGDDYESLIGQGFSPCPLCMKPAMRVETRGFEGIPLRSGYGWLIPSVTITNPTDGKMTVDATLLIDKRRLPAAREEETIETKVRPPRSTESRLSVPVDILPRGVVHGALVFVMPPAAYQNLPPDVRSTLSVATKVLEVTDLVSESVERVQMPPENQTIVVPPIVLPQPNLYHKLRRLIRAVWK